MQELTFESQTWPHSMAAAATATASAADVNVMNSLSLHAATQKETDTSNGLLSTRRTMPASEKNGHASTLGGMDGRVAGTFSAEDLNEPDVLESLVSSLNQLGLLQQAAGAGSGGDMSQMHLPPSTNPSSSGYCWPVAEDSTYGQSGYSLSGASSDANAILNASLASQLQSLSAGIRSGEQQRRAITGHQPDGLAALGLQQQLLQQHRQQQQQQQYMANNSRTYINSSMVPPFSTAGNNQSWGAMNGVQGGLGNLNRGNIQHGRSMSVQNINMSGNGAGTAAMHSAAPGNFGRTPNYFGGSTVGAGGLGAAGLMNSSLAASARYGNGKSFPEHLQLSKLESTPSYNGRGGAMDRLLLKNLLPSTASGTGAYHQSAQGGYDSQKMQNSDNIPWFDLMRFAQDRGRDTDGLLDATNTSFGQWDSKLPPQVKGSSFPYGFPENHQTSGGGGGGVGLNTNSSKFSSLLSTTIESNEVFSRKVFVGGLPPDIDEEEIMAAFRQVGQVTVDWPHKAESKSYFPPKGYCFLLFQDELSVQALVESCRADDGKLYWAVSSPTMKDKLVQIRPWKLDDSDFVMDGTQPLDPRKTVFVGGVPRPLRAFELAVIMGRLYGSVCYAGIDTDPELKYPKGAGRVAFSNQQSYIAAISARFVQLQHGDIDKRVEVKPYVLDDQICDECQGVHSGGKYAPYFCANVTCLQYYCERCWNVIHSAAGREFHKPLMKEGADRPRAMPFRW